MWDIKITASLYIHKVRMTILHTRIDSVRSALMGAKVSDIFRSVLETDVRNVAEDIAASTVPLAEWKPLKVNPYEADFPASY